MLSISSSPKYLLPLYLVAPANGRSDTVKDGSWQNYKGEHSYLLPQELEHCCHLLFCLVQHQIQLVHSSAQYTTLVNASKPWPCGSCCTVLVICQYPSPPSPSSHNVICNFPNLCTAKLEAFQSLIDLFAVTLFTNNVFRQFTYI